MKGKYRNFKVATSFDGCKIAKDLGIEDYEIQLNGYRVDVYFDHIKDADAFKDILRSKMIPVI